MQDSYLFRGKRVDNGKWVQGGLWPPCYYNAGEYTIHDGTCGIRVNSATVGQCTGLRDKSGKLIFQGDICTDHMRSLFVVEWDKENARFLGLDNKRRFIYVGREPAVKIIGNTHDNPELLEGSE